MSKRRTLFIVPSLVRAGAENQLVQLVNGLSDAVFDKHLLTYLANDDLLTQVDRRSIEYHAVLREHKVDLRAAREIGQVIDAHEIEVVHCTLENALLYGLLGARYSARRPAFVCALHSTTLPTWKHRVADAMLYRHLLRKCTQVWFMCQAQASLWTKRMPYLAGKQEVIYNGVKTEDFQPDRFVQAGRQLREEHGIAPSDQVVCCIAGFRPEKSHDVLLRAFSRYRSDFSSDCYLLLAGAGPMESKLRQLAGELGIDSRVKFLGGLSDVRPVLAAADCKVLPSEAETFSMAMLESMAMQVPVISTRVGGAGEAIDEERSGLLITPGDVAELTQKIAWILDDDDRRIDVGRAARETVENRFTYAKMVERSADCLLQVT